MILQEDQLLDKIDMRLFRVIELMKTEIGGKRAGQYLWLIASLIWDKRDAKGRFLLGLRRAPAAKKNHHAREGGLVEHLLEMWDLWQSIRCTRLEFLEEPTLSNRNVWEQIFLHDLEKADSRFLLVNTVPWTVEYAEEPIDLMLSINPVRVVEIVGRYGITLNLQQLNALFSAEGGYAKAASKSVSALGKVVYLLDELSGNVLAPIQRGDPDNLVPARRY